MLSKSFHVFRDDAPLNNVCLFSNSSRSHHPSMRSIMVLRLDLTLSRSGLRGPSSEKAGEGGGRSSAGTVGTGGICSTGLGVSLTRTDLTRMAAVGGGGSHGRCALSESDESLSNRFSWRAMAAVPRLRARTLTGPGAGAGARPAVTVPGATPRPHLQFSMSLGAGALVRFHRHSEVTAEKAKSTHRAMLRPQMALIW